MFSEGLVLFTGPLMTTRSDFAAGRLVLGVTLLIHMLMLLLVVVVFTVAVDDEQEIIAKEAATDDEREVMSVPELTGMEAIGRGDGVPRGMPCCATDEAFPTKFAVLTLLDTVVTDVKLAVDVCTNELLALLLLELLTDDWSLEFSWFFTSEIRKSCALYIKKCIHQWVNCYYYLLLLTCYTCHSVDLFHKIKRFGFNLICTNTYFDPSRVHMPLYSLVNI